MKLATWIGSLSALGLLIVTLWGMNSQRAAEERSIALKACEQYLRSIDELVALADAQRGILETEGFDAADPLQQATLVEKQVAAAGAAERRLLRSFGADIPNRLEVIRTKLESAAFERKYTQEERHGAKLTDYERAAAEFLEECQNFETL